MILNFAHESNHGALAIVNPWRAYAARPSNRNKRFSIFFAQYQRENDLFFTNSCSIPLSWESKNEATDNALNGILFSLTRRRLTFVPPERPLKLRSLVLAQSAAHDQCNKPDFWWCDYHLDYLFGMNPQGLKEEVAKVMIRIRPKIYPEVGWRFWGRFTISTDTWFVLQWR